VLPSRIGLALKKFIPPISSSSGIATALEEFPTPEQPASKQKKNQKRLRVVKKEEDSSSTSAEFLKNESSTLRVKDEENKAHQDVQKQRDPESKTEDQKEEALAFTPSQSKLTSINIFDLKPNSDAATQSKQQKGSLAYTEQIQEKRRSKNFKKGALLDEKIE
jgi:hypothetical protein